jgi:hypothetical protein
MPRLNKRLLNKVIAHILEEPRRLEMNQVLCPARDLIREQENRPPCGTVGCIAGWTYVLSRKKPRLNIYPGTVWRIAQKELGLSTLEAERLFAEPRHAGNGYYEAFWPIKLARRYLAAKTQRKRAEITVERIRLFAETNKQE